MSHFASLELNLHDKMEMIRIESSHRKQLSPPASGERLASGSRWVVLRFSFSTITNKDLFRFGSWSVSKEMNCIKSSAFYSSPVR